MKKKLKLKKITVRDLDTETTEKVNGATWDAACTNLPCSCPWTLDASQGCCGGC